MDTEVHPEPDAWKNAPAGDFFDDIDTVLAKLTLPHPDELSRIYERDRCTDPLSPVGSDNEEESEVTKGGGEFHVVQDDLFKEALTTEFSHIDDEFLDTLQQELDTFRSFSAACPPCVEDYARGFELECSKLYPAKLMRISEKKFATLRAQRNCSIFYELYACSTDQLFAILAFNLKNKLSRYMQLLRDFLASHLTKQLFDRVLEKLFESCSNPLHMLVTHNKFIVSLWPNFDDIDRRRHRNAQPFGGVDLAFFDRLYRLPKRKRRKPDFADLFHSEIPEVVVDSKSDDTVDFSFDAHNLPAVGEIVPKRPATNFRNTKIYLDKLRFELRKHGTPLPNASLPDSQQPPEHLEQLRYIRRLWLGELTSAHNIDFTPENLKKFNISKANFARWYMELLRQSHLKPEVSFVSLTHHNPHLQTTDNDFDPTLIPVHRRPLMSAVRCDGPDRRLVNFCQLQTRFVHGVKNSQCRDIQYIESKAIDLCHIALQKFMKNVITELIRLKPTYRGVNKKFGRMMLIDGIVPTQRTEQYPDLIQQVHATSLENILLSEDDREHAHHNSLYRIALEQSHFDVPRNRINLLDLYTSLHLSETILPARPVWKAILDRLAAKFQQDYQKNERKIIDSS